MAHTAAKGPAQPAPHRARLQRRKSVKMLPLGDQPQAGII